MDETDFTPRNVAKWLAKAAIHAQVAQMTKNALVDNTSLEADSKRVKLGSNVVGWGVSSKLKPYTDKAVDKTADYINEKREARNTKKDDTTPETEK